LRASNVEPATSSLWAAPRKDGFRRGEKTLLDLSFLLLAGRRPVLLFSKGVVSLRCSVEMDLCVKVLELEEEHLIYSSGEVPERHVSVA